MKYSEMNSRQKLVTRITLERCGWVVGGLENVLQDFLPEDEEYKLAREQLADHDGLVDEIYWEVIGCSDRGYMKHIRFVGKAFIIERIENRLRKWGY